MSLQRHAVKSTKVEYEQPSKQPLKFASKAVQKVQKHIGFATPNTTVEWLFCKLQITSL
jgi:hypothetical protein